MSHTIFPRSIAAAVLLALGLASTPVWADEALDREFEFAAGLIKLGLPEYAEKLVDKLVMANPGEGDRANVIRAEALVARRRFKQAEEIVAGMAKDSPKAQAIMLALADGYYQTGDFDRCKLYYTQFFNQYTNSLPTDPDLLRFYESAAYKFGQMMSLQNDPKTAAAVYEMLEKANTDKAKDRQIRLEHTEFLLRAAQAESGADREVMLKKVEAELDVILWGGMDLWFGRGITSMAQLAILRGQKDDAAKLLQTNMKMLKKLDDVLKDYNIPVSESPFAGARSLLGSLYADDGALFIGTPEKRQAEALSYLDRACTEYNELWSLIVRANKNDVAVAESAKKTGRDVSTVLTGSVTQRRKPFEDLAAAVKGLGDTVNTLSDKGWEPAVLPRANALKERIRALQAAIAEYPKDVGVSPTVDMTIGDDFRGKVLIKRGMDFLGADDFRKERAVALFSDALQEFYAVFIGYPGSDWNKQAAPRVTQLKDQLRGLTGKEVSIEARKGGREKIAMVTIKEAQSLFFRKDYSKAIDEYIRGLNDNPEGDEALVALSNVMECYARQTNTVFVKTVALYISERFRNYPEAPKALLRMGRFYFDGKDRPMYMYIYDLYLSRFPAHPDGAIILFVLGEQCWGVQDYDGAVQYYRRITEKYQKSSYYLKALNKISWAFYLSKNYTNAIPAFTAYLAESQPSAEKAQAKLCLADSYRQVNDFTNAVVHYKELTEWLGRKDDTTYASSAGDIEKNRDVLEQAAFFHAYTKSRLAAPGAAGAADRQASIELYRQFVEQFAKSKLAPSALSSMGAVLLSDGKSEEASKVFEELSAKYPESEAGQNARFAMVRSLLEIGQPAKADEVFRDMLKETAKYPTDQFLRLGQLMAERGDNDMAVEAFSRVVELVRTPKAGETPKQIADMEQLALMGMGKVFVAQGRFDRAAESLESLVNKYPLSALFYEARFLLGGAYKQLGKLDEAVAVLKDVFNRASDQALINRATIELAAIQMAQKDTNGALASYQRIVLLGNPDDPAIRPAYKEALVQSIPVFLSLSRWQDALENCNLYTTRFPSGERLGEVLSWKSKAMMSLAVGP